MATSIGLRRHLPNILTVGRLVALPFFVVLLWHAPQGRSLAAAVLFAAAALTDWFDGFLARRFGVSTRFGRLADPLADRLLIGSALIELWHHGRLPFVVVLIVIGRDIALLSGFGLVAAGRGYELSVAYVGKLATFVLMGALCLFMLTHRGALAPVLLLWTGVVLSLAAAVVYVSGARRSRKPSTSR